MQVRGRMSKQLYQAYPDPHRVGVWWVRGPSGSKYRFDSKEEILRNYDEVHYKEESVNSLGYPDNNPKTRFGMLKVPLHLVPPSVKHFLAKAFGDGAQKYGPYNWRDKKVSASIYYSALNRHMDAWWDGEDVASDSNIEHLAHALACIGIIVDAQANGSLIDDRPTKGAAARLQQDYMNKGENIERNENTVVKSGLSCCEENVLPTTGREQR